MAGPCDCWMCANPRFRSVHATPVEVRVLDDALRAPEERARLN